MLFTCPACKRKTIFFPTVLLHVWGRWPHSAANRFECTHCHAELACYYSPVPFLLLGAILQILILQSGAIRDLWMGALIAAGLALFFFPIREASNMSLLFHRFPVRQFNNPFDQGFYYIESKLLSQLVFVLVAGLTLKSLVQANPGAQAHAGSMVFLLLAGVVGLAAAIAYGFAIYRIGRHGTLPRVGVNVALMIGVVVMVYYWR